MSRHEFEQPGIRVAIGWDAPLATFFLQVWNDALVTAEMDEDERDSPQIWLGMEYAEHPDPEPLLLLARKHLPSLPAYLDETLRDEMDLDPARSLPADHGEMVRLLQDLMTEAKHGSEQKRRD